MLVCFNNQRCTEHKFHIISFCSKITKNNLHNSKWTYILWICSPCTSVRLECANSFVLASEQSRYSRACGLFSLFQTKQPQFTFKLSFQRTSCEAVFSSNCFLLMKCIIYTNHFYCSSLPCYVRMMHTCCKILCAIVYPKGTVLPSIAQRRSRHLYEIS